MIVPNMNSQELITEVFKDLEVVNRKATYLTQGLRREAVKSKTKCVHKVFDYKSMRYNDWIIVVDYLVSEPSFAVVVYYRDQYGLNGILVDGTHQVLIHFTPHFLDRYNERFLKQMGGSKVELLKRFVPTNSLQVIKVEHKSEPNKNKIFGRFEEGIGLGYMEVFHGKCKEIHHFKTFISNEMVLEHQLEDFNYLGIHYEKYWTETHREDRRCA